MSGWWVLVWSATSCRSPRRTRRGRTIGTVVSSALLLLRKIRSVELTGQIKSQRQVFRDSAAGDLPEGRSGTVLKGQREDMRPDAGFNREGVLCVADHEAAKTRRTFEHEERALAEAQAATEAEEPGIASFGATGAGVMDPYRGCVERQSVADVSGDDAADRRREVGLFAPFGVVEVVLAFD